jgi:hypothetical protein
MKIINLMFYLLPNGAHYHFFNRVTDELEQASSTIVTALGTLIAELNDWHAKEEICMAWIQRSTFTDLIADANHRLDNALVGLSAQVNAARYSPIPDVVAAAERLYIMLKSYGKVITKPYLQKNGAVQAILIHLNGDFAEDVLLLDLVTWKTELAAALAEFTSLFEQREAQTLGRPKQKFIEVRRGIENVWRQMIELINSGAALNLSPDFVTFINSLNPEIKYLNQEFHRIRHDISTAEPAPIPPQPYTGEACTPVPEVIFFGSKKSLKLILGKDFSVTYKNNINAGNAYCTICGKGSYKGSKTVTFIIK